MVRKRKEKGTSAGEGSFYDRVRASISPYDPKHLGHLIKEASEARVDALAAQLAEYIGKHLPKAIRKRSALADYRTNPYVLFTCAKVMDLQDSARFAKFLFDNKLYMGLETSFGKQVERAFVGQYPVAAAPGGTWADPAEKVDEARGLKGLAREEKAKKRLESVWREIDKSCVVGNARYLVSVKSGPNCINDSQVAAMTAAIADNYGRWMEATRRHCPDVDQLHVVVGITYGTNCTTNNKENQILVKLLDRGFVEEDPVAKPGVLIDRATRAVRVYRRIGQEFWAMIGDPACPSNAPFVFLEVLLALTQALSKVLKNADIEAKIADRMQRLEDALKQMVSAPNTLPSWVRNTFAEDDLFYFATALSAFYDNGV